MNEDFNPLDLSAAPRKPEEPTQAEVIQPRPTVNRVSMGPIFHSRITKLLAAGLSIILAVLVGYSATSYYLNRKANSQSTKTELAEVSKVQPEADSQAEKKAASETETPAAADAPTSSPATPAPAEQVPCGVATMPQGVCTAIESIESTGLKNNQYVSADTSRVPDGSTVVIDEKSWVATSAETGTVKFTAVMAGKTYTGVGTLQSVGGSWKVVSYILN